MSNRSKIFAIGVVTMGIAAWVGAQVDIALRPAALLPNDPLVQLDQIHAPQGQLIYMVPVSVPGPPTRMPSDLVIVPTGTSAAKEFHRLVAPFAEAVFGPQLIPDVNSTATASTTSVLVKVGWPYEELSTYKLYRWNWKTSDLKSGPAQSLHFRSVFPSPSGRYTAFVTGGDAMGKDWGQPRTQPLALHIYDWQNRKAIDVARKPTSTDIVWTPQETLLFSSLEENSPAPTEAKGQVLSLPDKARNAVFELNPQQKADSLLISNAYDPVVSPDGQQIMVSGWNFPSAHDERSQSPQQRKEEDRSSLALSFGAVPAPHLWMFSRENKGKTLLLNKIPLFYRWQLNNRDILVCEQTYMGEIGENFINRGSIFQINTVTKQKTEVTHLDASDARPTSEEWAKKRFVFAGWGDTADQIVLSKLDLTGVNGDGLFLLQATFSSVDLKQGKRTDFAVFKYTVEDLLGVDWKPSSKNLPN